MATVKIPAEQRTLTDQGDVKPSKKSIGRIKEQVRSHLRPSNQAPWPVVALSLNRTLQGWANYFSYGTRLMAYRAIDNYVYACVRHFLTRRHKVPTRGTRRYPAEQVFGPLGVVRLRPLHVGARSWASA